jgi:hypothetical protein
MNVNRINNNIIFPSEIWHKHFFVGYSMLASTQIDFDRVSACPIDQVSFTSIALFPCL